jgi:hypothetical protein
MSKPKPISDDAAKAAFLAKWRAKHQAQEPVDRTDDMTFEDFRHRTFAGKEDPDSQHIFAEWLVCHLLGISSEHTRRLYLDNASLRLPHSYLVKVAPLGSADGREHYVLCRYRQELDRNADTWCARSADNWKYFFYTQHELEVAGVPTAMTLKAFLRREMPMGAREFQFVARGRLGLEQ